jgi:E3 ubiquitin-protein ligase RGLG
MAIEIIGRTLEPFDDDRLIPAYGFGSAETSDRAVFAFNPGDRPCQGFVEVLARYQSIAARATMAGPTTFGPVIRRAVEVVAASGGKYHILLIIADGEVTRPQGLSAGVMSQWERDTAAAIVEASQWPLSIVMVGVGDGPWEQMRAFDDRLPHRAWDNFQFVSFEESVTRRGATAEFVTAEAQAQFALDALMEVPDQYRIIQTRGLLSTMRPLAHAPAAVLGPPDGGGAPLAVAVAPGPPPPSGFGAPFGSTSAPVFMAAPGHVMVGIVPGAVAM